MIKFFQLLALFFFFLILACSSLRSKPEAEKELAQDLSSDNFSRAAERVDRFRQKNIYLQKDRALFYLNKGLIYHYQGKYDTSNFYLEKADRAMEELFTRSIRKAILSMMANDNVLDYTGEVYDNLYVNIFKALNYIALDELDEAYVEIRRVNDKLTLLELKYSDWVDQWNSEDTTGFRIEKQHLNFYDDVLAHFLSYLIFRSEFEEDNARVSFENVHRSWRIHSEIYDYDMPHFFQEEPRPFDCYLNVLAFTGNAPRKTATGGKITTFEDFIIISGVQEEEIKVWLNLSGLEEGWHFKFAFPELHQTDSRVRTVRVTVNDSIETDLQLLEDIGRVAEFTFQSKKNIIFMKTAARALLKGIASHRTKETLQKETKTKDNFLLRNIINLGVDAIVDASENPDLRSWTTLPQKCLAAELELNPGVYDITIRFLGEGDRLLNEKKYPEFTVDFKLNLLETFYLD